MTVHVIGAGIAGMAAAMALREAGARVVVWEAAGHAGGRARSFHDTRLGCVIDNGNHLMLAANAAVLRLASRLGGEAALRVLPEARFPMFDLEGDRRYDFLVTPLAGPLTRPRFVARDGSDAPRPGAGDWLRIAALPLRAGGTVEAALGEAPSWRVFWHPFTLGVLNTDPGEAALAPLLAVMRETFLRGAAALRPVIAREGLSAAFATPFETLAAGGGGVELHLHTPLRTLCRDGDRITALEVGRSARRRVDLAPEDGVILAVPPWEARRLLPEIAAPDDFRPIVNVHYRLEAGRRPSPDDPPFVGIVGGMAQWVFVRGDVISTTISDARAVADRPGREIAAACWPEVSRALGIAGVPEPPPWQVIVERRATFACTTAQLARRPPAETGYANLFLAGDWTATGLPATLEGAARAGERAAQLALAAAT